MVRIRRRLLISGRVQGVFFRDSARTMAIPLGVTGFVRNLPDGRVEVVVEGEEEPVESLIRWCRRGPDSARVDHLKILEEPVSGLFETFTIQRSPR